MSIAYKSVLGSSGGGSQPNVPFLGLALDWANKVSLPYNSGAAYEYTTPSKGVFIFSYMANSNTDYIQAKPKGDNNWRQVLYAANNSDFNTVSFTHNYIASGAGVTFKLKLNQYDANTITNVFVPFKEQTIKVPDWSEAIRFTSSQSNYVTPSDGMLVMNNENETKIAGVSSFRKGVIYVPSGVTCNFSYPSWFVPMESDSNSSDDDELGGDDEYDF